MADQDHDTKLRLPVYFTNFIGRQREIEALLEIVTPAHGAQQPCESTPRFVTIVGVGGAGKTRLASALARTLTEPGRGADPLPPDGVAWANLAPLTDSTSVVHTVAASFDLPKSVSRDPVNALVNALRDKRALLVLDNCEEVALACAQLADILLPACPQLVILATSRTPLEVAHGCSFPIPALGVDPDASRATDGTAGDGEATRLFYDRAAMVLPTYPLVGGDGPTVDALCQRLGGLPLAIELAATWIRVLSAGDLLTEITRNLDLLSSDNPTLPERHHSMRAVLDSSWRWLSSAEQRVLRGLGIFLGGFTREAAEAVSGATLATLATMAERSLINRLPDSGGGTRYGMHELVRQYALEMLEQQDPAEADRIRERHLEYFLALAEEAGTAWDGAREREWLDRLRADQANVNSALTWGLDHRQSEPVLRLCAAYHRVWVFTSPSRHYLPLLERALALPWDSTSVAAASARAQILNTVGYDAIQLADTHRGRQLFEEALALYEGVGDLAQYAYTLRGYGSTFVRAGDPQSAKRHISQSLALCRRANDLIGVAWSLTDLGEATFAANEIGDAGKLFTEALANFQQLGNPFGTYCAYVALGEVYCVQDQWVDALEAYGQALTRQRQSHFTAQGAAILDGLASIAVALHRPDLSAVLFGAGEMWRESYGHWEALDTDQQRQQLIEAQQQAQSGTWSAQYRAAYRLTAEEARSEAERISHELARLCQAPLPNGLTEREGAVIRLVAEGLSNADIATRLVVSPRTVHAHLRSIFDKLEVTTRTAAAREASRLGLT